MNALLKDVWEGVRSQPGRTGLSFLAVAIGMVALAVLLAALGGLEERSREILREFGYQVFAILPGSAKDRDPGQALTEAQAARLAANLPDCRVTTLRRFEHKPPGNAASVVVAATDENLAGIRQWRLVRGRFLDAHDVRMRERNAVITAGLGTLPGWDLGKVVTLMNVPFTVVGVIAAEGGALESEASEPRVTLGQRVAYVPRTTSGLWQQRDAGNPHEVSAILVQASADEDVGLAVARAQRVLSERGATWPAYDWVTPDVVVRGVRRLEATIGYTVGSVAVLCLILGGTTLMSLMIVNVRDRVTEIGLRRALGATRADVAMLFVVEACLVTGAAALLATAATHLVLWFGGAYLPLPLRLDALTFFSPLGVAVLLAAVFSYGPAKLAAGISPSEALRSE